MQKHHYSSFEEFWPYYVTQHAHPLSRKLHFWGTNNLFLWLLIAFLRRSPRLILFAVISSYTYAWVGHFLVERNRPATLDYPILSAIGDLKMYIRIWQGQMDAEAERYGKAVSE
jgi:hypothetical protein